MEYVTLEPTIEDETKKPKGKKEKTENTDADSMVGTIFHVTENFLSKSYDFRYNTISLEIEMSRKDQNEWGSCNENSLWIELQKAGVKVPIASLLAILKSGFVEHYNPLKDYFENLTKYDPKTEPDFIAQYLNYCKLANPKDYDKFHYHFKKWLVRSVKCVLDPNFFNKQAFILSDNGRGQNIGKTSWIRFLMPESLNNYIAEDISSDKDARVLLVKNFLINLDELAVLDQKEINHLKAYFSKTQINERLPYDRKNSILPRIASFIGSTNMSTFLRDETGSVRWLIFTIKDIDWSYKKNFKIDNLWRQVVHLVFDKNFDPDLTKQDIAENEKQNEQYTVSRPELEIIQNLFSIPQPGDTQASFLTSTQILVYIQNNSKLPRLASEWVGRAMNKLGYNRTKQHDVWGYWIKYNNQPEDPNTFFDPVTSKKDEEFKTLK